MSNQQKTEHTSRPDNRLAIFWEDYKTVEYWERHTCWSVMSTTFESLATSMADRKTGRLRQDTLLWISLAFDSNVVNDENMHVEDGNIPYRVNLRQHADADEVDHLSAFAHAFTVAREAIEWLETDPLVDGVQISRHRWNWARELHCKKYDRDAKAAQDKMLDPAFSRSEAKEIMDAIHDKAVSRGSARLTLQGRKGTTRANNDCRIRAESDTVRSTGYGGGWTNRVSWTRGGSKVAKKYIMRELQEEFSAIANRDWKEKIS